MQRPPEATGIAIGQTLVIFTPQGRGGRTAVGARLRVFIRFELATVDVALVCIGCNAVRVMLVDSLQRHWTRLLVQLLVQSTCVAQ